MAASGLTPTYLTSYPSGEITTLYQINDNIGWLSKFIYPFEYENTFSDHSAQIFTANNLWLPVAICLIYYFGIFGGQRLMKNRKAFDLKTTLALWNLGLSVFSIIGALRTAPQLIFYLYHFGYTGLITQAPNASYGSGPSGVWTMLFIFSKIPELVDTVFIVLRKKPLIFLHWYHHITVLLYCWHAYATGASSGLFFVAMNFTVHAVMYFYYFLMAINRVPKAFKPIYVTLLQISQMIAGVAICTSSIYYKFFGNIDVQIQNSNLAASVLMYGSYLYLFCEFFYKRFVTGSKKPATARRPAAAESAHDAAKKTQ